MTSNTFFFIPQTPADWEKYCKNLQDLEYSVCQKSSVQEKTLQLQQQHPRQRNAYASAAAAAVGTPNTIPYAYQNYTANFTAVATSYSTYLSHHGSSTAVMAKKYLGVHSSSRIHKPKRFTPYPVNCLQQKYHLHLQRQQQQQYQMLHYMNTPSNWIFNSNPTTAYVPTPSQHIGEVAANPVNTQQLNIGNPQQSAPPPMQNLHQGGYQSSSTNTTTTTTIFSHTPQGFGEGGCTSVAQPQSEEIDLELRL